MVDGRATPVLQRVKPGLLTVDAKTGFAHPAIDLGFAALIPLAREQGIAALAIHNSYNCGVLGYHTERLARARLLALGFTHAPPSIPPIGGFRPIVGTNPFAIPVADGASRLVEVIAGQEGVHLQGSGRGAARARADRAGIAVDDATFAKARALAGAAG